MSQLTANIIEKLAVLKPSKLDIVNQSALHQGHAGWNDSGETHFLIKISSPEFVGRGKIDCHKLIYKLLAAELKDQIHALAIEIE